MPAPLDPVRRFIQRTTGLRLLRRDDGDGLRPRGAAEEFELTTISLGGSDNVSRTSSRGDEPKDSVAEDPPGRLRWDGGASAALESHVR